MARRRFQTGTLSKLGKRRKVWVMRWREDALLDNGTVGRIQRAETIGTVADLPTRREALAKMEERLREVNQGTGRPEASMTFGAFVESQWKVLAWPNFKPSTQHGYKTVLSLHVLPAWRKTPLRGHRPARHSAMGGREVPAPRGVANGSEFVGAALEHPRIGGRIRLSAGEPGAGREVPAKGAEAEAEADRRR